MGGGKKSSHLPYEIRLSPCRMGHCLVYFALLLPTEVSLASTEVALGWLRGGCQYLVPVTGTKLHVGIGNKLCGVSQQ